MKKLNVPRIIYLLLFTDPIFATSRRGKQMLLIGVQKFLYDKANGVKIRWRCHRHYYKCRAYVVTIENNVIKTYLNHNHRIIE